MMISMIYNKKTPTRKISENDSLGLHNFQDFYDSYDIRTELGRFQAE